MEKVDLSTANIATENAAKLAELFPDVLTEVMDEDGNVHYGIDAEALRVHVGDIAEGKRERYQFTWPGKQRARAEAIRQIDKTMRPVPEESVNWDTTENLYIEGDNLDALKILRETYAGKIKMIYIDPPYNTGHDFVYNDSFARSAEEERAESGAFDEEGNLIDLAYRMNNESNGRFHSDWCSMMHPRLVLARDLLSEDGVLCISISDDEAGNLKIMLDSVFGESNFCGDILWNSTKSVTNTALISVSHTYNFIYFKSKDWFTGRREEFRLPDKGEGFSNPDNDPRGPWKADPFQVGGWRPNQQYEIVNPNTGVVYHPNVGCSWKNDYQKYLKLVEDGRIVFGKTGEGGPQRKRYMFEALERGSVSSTWWDDVDTTTNGTQLLKKIFDGSAPFSNPKPIGLLKRLLQLCANREAFVLDFFSGSATTAHAVMQLNAEDGGNRKFIMVQLPEVCDEKSEAAKAGYSTICEIGKERIRRAGAKIAAEVEQANAQLKLGEEPKRVPDIGFRVLKIDSSNFKDVKSTPDAIQQDQLFGMADNLKPDRTPEDILFQLFPQFEIPFTARIEKLSIGGKTVYSVDDDTLLACFDAEVSEDVIRAMATRQPLRAVLRDASFIGDDALTNFEEIFKTLSPSTETRVV